MCLSALLRRPTDGQRLDVQGPRAVGLKDDPLRFPMVLRVTEASGPSARGQISLSSPLPNEQRRMPAPRALLRPLMGLQG